MRRKKHDERRDDRHGHVAIVADPEDGHAIDDNVPDRAAADGRHQGEYAEAEDVHALARGGEGAADSKRCSAKHFEAVDEARLMAGLYRNPVFRA